MKAWISASRPRTLPLAAASVCMGGFLAAFQGLFNWLVFMLTLLTTLLLQILSNLANDYGDSQNGADRNDRIGPTRMVQAGEISARQMKQAMWVIGTLSFLAGLGLLSASLGFSNPYFYVFLIFGILCIYAAVGYTSGNKPYGYRGYGDLAVVVFFGLMAVFGSYFLQTFSLEWDVVLPAITCGLFATAVLNINNIRDIESDKRAGKYSIPVRLGRERAVVYHWFLLGIGLLCSIAFTLLNYFSWWQWLFLIIIPLLYTNGKAIQTKPSDELDPYLKHMALTTLFYVLSFGMGLIISAAG